MDAQVASFGGCKFFISDAHATLRKEKKMKAALLKIRGAAVNTTTWRCGSTAETTCSSNRAVLKDIPNAPPRREEDSSSSTGRPKMTLKEVVAARVGVRCTSPARVKHSASLVLEETLADKRANIVSDSAYIQICDELGPELDITKLECQLCPTMNDVRAHCCYNCKSTFGAHEEERHGLKRPAANVALRMSFCSRHMTRGFLSKALDEAKRPLKYAKRARCDGFASIANRYAKDKVYADRMDLSGISRETMQEWDGLYQKRERSPLPVYSISPGGIADQLESAVGTQRHTTEITRSRTPTASSAIQTSRLPATIVWTGRDVALVVMAGVVLDSLLAVRRCMKLSAQSRKHLGDECAVACGQKLRCSLLGM